MEGRKILGDVSLTQNSYVHLRISIIPAKAETKRVDAYFFEGGDNWLVILLG